MQCHGECNTAIDFNNKTMTKERLIFLINLLIDNLLAANLQEDKPLIIGEKIEGCDTILSIKEIPVINYGLCGMLMFMEYKKEITNSECKELFEFLKYELKHGDYDHYNDYSLFRTINNGYPFFFFKRKWEIRIKWLKEVVENLKNRD